MVWFECHVVVRTGYFKMYPNKQKFWILAAIFFVIGLQSWSLAADKDRWCFQFTWLGPNADNMSIEHNFTCSDLPTEPKPCFTPFVITDDGTPPDTNYMWKKFSDAGDIEAIAKPLTRSEVCIKWSVYFDGAVENISYFKGKMVDDDDNAIYNECETMTKGAYTIEACACRDYLGIPCNAAPYRATVDAYVVLMLATIALWTFVWRDC